VARPTTLAEACAAFVGHCCSNANRPPVRVSRPPAGSCTLAACTICKLARGRGPAKPPKPSESVTATPPFVIYFSATFPARLRNQLDSHPYRSAASGLRSQMAPWPSCHRLRPPVAESGSVRVRVRWLASVRGPRELGELLPERPPENIPAVGGRSYAANRPSGAWPPGRTIATATPPISGLGFDRCGRDGFLKDRPRGHAPASCSSCSHSPARSCPGHSPREIQGFVPLSPAGRSPVPHRLILTYFPRPLAKRPNPISRSARLVPLFRCDALRQSSDLADRRSDSALFEDHSVESINTVPFRRRRADGALLTTD